MSEPHHPACPLDDDAPWRLERVNDGAALADGSGLASGLRALWRFALRESVDGSGRATGSVAQLRIGVELGARGVVAVALQPEDNSVLLRIRGWLESPKGVVLLDQLSLAHARLVLGSERWIQPDPRPESESLAPLTLASVLDEPEALIRALKPGH